jgi:hypothetical protein
MNQNNRFKEGNMIKYINLKLIFILLVLFSSCSTEQENELNLQFDINPRLEKIDGEYYLDLQETWQTLHRVSGTITNNNLPIEGVKIYWKSNLYWYLDDTLGYVVKRGLSDDLEYKSYDTIYVTGFNGFEVPTSNEASYSNSKGEVNNMIAPVKIMVGDTLILSWWYEYDSYISEPDSISILLR